jgi:hypothetical protein
MEMKILSEKGRGRSYKRTSKRRNEKEKRSIEEEKE